MLLALILLLNLTDHSFFNHEKILSKISLTDAMKISEPELCVVTPKKINYHKHNSVPVFSAFVTNDFFHYKVSPFSHGYLLLNSYESGESHFFYLYDNSMKPSEEELKSRVQPDKYDGLSKIGSKWNDISLKSLSDGDYSIRLYCGEMVSNISTFQITGVGENFLYRKSNNSDTIHAINSASTNLALDYSAVISDNSTQLKCNYRFPENYELLFKNDILGKLIISSDNTSSIEELYIKLPQYNPFNGSIYNSSFSFSLPRNLLHRHRNSNYLYLTVSLSNFLAEPQVIRLH